ncbi:MAG: BON domain-containing protein [Chitinimonas sp.]|nr:BON domain-containing protein [Chitinimonas sp.]
MQNRHLLPGLLAAMLIAGPAIAADVAAAPAPQGGPAAEAGQYVDDATITTKVKAAIMGEKSLSALDVKVTTVQGVVTLTGTVDKVEAADKARQVASAIAGVKRVDSKLQLKSATN